MKGGDVEEGMKGVKVDNLGDGCVGGAAYDVSMRIGVSA